MMRRLSAWLRCPSRLAGPSPSPLGERVRMVDVTVDRLDLEVTSYNPEVVQALLDSPWWCDRCGAPRDRVDVGPGETVPGLCSRCGA